MSIQIPNLHTSNRTKAQAREATVFISTRQGGGRSGTFMVNGTLSFNPAVDDYPNTPVPVTIRVDLTDGAQATFAVTTVEQLDTTGKATPTSYATGRCKARSENRALLGCRYWLMMVDNRRRPSAPP